MAENLAIFIFRRRLSLGFSKCRWLRTSFRVPSRSMRFFNRRKAFSTGSPFFNLISVNPSSLPLRNPDAAQSIAWRHLSSQAVTLILGHKRVNVQNGSD
jgi:hypothetical protein